MSTPTAECETYRFQAHHIKRVQVWQTDRHVSRSVHLYVDPLYKNAARRDATKPSDIFIDLTHARFFPISPQERLVFDLDTCARDAHVARTHGKPRQESGIKNLVRSQHALATKSTRRKRAGCIFQYSRQRTWVPLHHPCRCSKQTRSYPTHLS